jgi:hypothetical protein
MAKQKVLNPESVPSEPEAPKSKVKRFSNDDIYEFVAELKAEVDKEMNLRKNDRFTDGLKHENAAQLQGLSMGLQAVIQRYKIFAKPAKAF